MGKKKLKRKLERLEGAVELMRRNQRVQHDRWQGVREDIAAIVAQVGEHEDRLSPPESGVEATEFAPRTFFSTSSPRIVNLREAIPISAQQAKSMVDGGGWLMGYDRGNGWLFIGNLERSPEDDGNGVWHDVQGNEQHGPHGASS